MAGRKFIGKPKKEKIKFNDPPGLKVRRSINIDALPDVIVDNKFDCKIGECVILRKDYLEDVTISYCTVMFIDNETNRIDLYDETKQQMTAVQLSEAKQYTLKKEKSKK